MKLFGIPYDTRQIYYIVGDVFSTTLAVYFAHVLRFGWFDHQTYPWVIAHEAPASAVFFVCANLMMLYLADAYNSAIDFRKR